jgi:hypothetical protein
VCTVVISRRVKNASRRAAATASSPLNAAAPEIAANTAVRV